MGRHQFHTALRRRRQRRQWLLRQWQLLVVRVWVLLLLLLGLFDHTTQPTLQLSNLRVCSLQL